MPGRSGPISTFGKILFALPFLGIGLFTIWTGLRLGHAAIFPIAFGAVFAGTGAWQIVQALRQTRSIEERALRKKAVPDALPMPRHEAGYRVAPDASRSAREIYAAALDDAPLPKIAARPGEVLSFSLGLAQKSLLMDLVFATIWNVFSWGMFIAVAASGSGASLFVLIFVAVGVWLGVRLARRWLGRMRLGRVEIDAEPAWLGEDLEILVEQGGPLTILSYRVSVVCREQVKYTVGTDTRTEHYDVLELPLLDESAFRIAFRERWSRTSKLTLPADAPASFAAANNQVEWRVRVQAQIDNWPDYDESFAFRALPRLGT